MTPGGGEVEGAFDGKAELATGRKDSGIVPGLNTGAGNKSGSEKRGRKQGSSNTLKQVPFQPQDFPSLSGEVPIKEIPPITTIAPPADSFSHNSDLVILDEY